MEAAIKEVIDSRLYGPGINSENRFQRFLEISKKYENENFWYALKQAYISSDNLFQYKNEIKEAFMAKHPHRESLMSKTELKTWKELPDVLMIYRGMTIEEMESRDYGVSWTLDRKVAKFFAQDYRRNYTTNHLTRTVHQLLVFKKDLLAYFNERQEKEVIFISEIASKFIDR